MVCDFCYTPEQAMLFFRKYDFYALLDVREKGEFLQKHIPQASCAPLSRLEFIVCLLVPCKNILVILVDSGEKDDFRAQKAAGIMLGMGYTHLATLDGGLSGWQKSGYAVIEESCFIANGYAEYLESQRHVPGLTPEEVQKRLAVGEKIAFIDIRVPGEFSSMSIPGGINAPGCEAAYRFLDLVPSPETLVVVNCAARTRGILCARMLRDFGVPNPVVSLRGGTLNWRRSGYDLEHDHAQRTAPPSVNALLFAVERAKSLAKAYDIAFVDADSLRQWQSEDTIHPLYIFDVRQQEEYGAGHLAGSRCVPGGQLAQHFNEYASIHKARYVLVDDTEVRAIITAYWLKQLGLADVYVLKGGLGGSGMGRDGIEAGPAPQPPVECSYHNSISPKGLSEQLAGQAPPLVINVGYSDAHRKAHIPGAAWIPRSRLERVRREFPEARSLVLTSDCEMHARLAASDAKRLWPDAEVRFLAGGSPGWERERLPMEDGMPTAFSQEDDIWYLMYTDPKAPLESMERYFDWENKRADMIVRDGILNFCLP